MNELILCVATRRWPGWKQCLESWQRTADKCRPSVVTYDQNVVPAYQGIYQDSTEPILGFLHDDLEILEKGWDSRVLNCFNDSAIGVAGFGGALGHGAPDLYTTPYKLSNLARQDFLSNMRNAEEHGQRFTEERDVAILDGFALFVRRPILDKVGGWPVDKPVGYFMYSEWLCCEARRQGYRIRLVGVECDHLGGKTASMVQLTENYEEAHRYFYDHNRDVMPFRVLE